MAILPAGAYNTQKRTYTTFKVGDVVEGNSEKITRGMWSGGVGNLTTFFTSSVQSNTQKEYYYEIFNDVSSDPLAEPQFSVVYGNKFGNGSLSVNEDSPTKAIYSQYQQLLLPANKTTFEFDGVASDNIYAVNINRARLRDRLNAGNFQLNLAELNGGAFSNNEYTGSNVQVSASNNVISLIDDSDENLSTTVQRGVVYNLVSGSIANGISLPKTVYGKVYSEQGVVVLNGDTLNSALSFNTVSGSNVNGDNAFKIFTSISGAAAIDSDYGFVARNEERIQSTFFFVRAKNAEYNFSNNPTFVTGSDGELNQPTFVNDPKVYITTVGLYNNKQELLAVAKLSKPILKAFSNEILVKVKLSF
jgi:hypothetical protein